MGMVFVFGKYVNWYVFDAEEQGVSLPKIYLIK